MRHYVCVGDCVGVASNPGVCMTEGCTHEKQALISCSCDDEMHDEAFEKAPLQIAEIASEEDMDAEPSDDELMDIDADQTEEEEPAV